MLLEARRRTRVHDYPALAGLRAGRRIKYLSQEEVASLAEVSIHWYAMLERGDLSSVYSDDFLHRIATVLSLTDDERLTLFLLVEHRSLGSRVRGGMEANDRGREHLADSPLAAILGPRTFPILITDSTWNVLAANEEFYRWFPAARRSDNLMRMMLTDEATRAQLVNWKTEHAPVLVAQLRAELTKRPDEEALKDFVLGIIESSPFLDSLWENQTRCVFVEKDRRYEVLVADSSEPTTVVVGAWRSVDWPGLVMRAYVPVELIHPGVAVSGAVARPVTGGGVAASR